MGVIGERTREVERKRIEELRGLSVPERLVAENHELISLLESASKLREDRSAAFAERAADIFGLRLRRNELCASVAADVRTADDARYSDALAAQAAARDGKAEEFMLQREGVLTELVSDQEHLRVPKRFQAEHDLLCKALRAELAAMCKHHEALNGSDIQAVRRAATAFEHTIEARAARLEEVGFRPVRLR
jgi:hypothetical protein